MSIQKFKKKLFFIIISLLTFINSFNPIDDFNYTHWLFNYNFQFIKRGFIGQILNAIHILPSIEIIYVFSYCILFLMFYLFVKFFYDAIKPLRKEKGLILFFLLVLFHSATLQHFHYDLGRFDQIGIIAAILLIMNLHKASKSLQIVIVFLTFLILILIHEALFVMFGPMVLVYWIFLNSYDIKFNILKTMVFIFLGIATLVISNLGLMKAISSEIYYEMLASKYGKIVDRGAVLTLYRNFADNFEFTYHIGFSYGHHLLMLIVVGPVIFLLSILFYKYIHKANDFIERLKFIFLNISALSPLLLYPIAVDRFRWISITITNLFIITAILIKNKKFKIELINVVEKYKYNCISYSST
uniref:Wzy n=1 Tax=Ignavibacterium album TaxID=591197 RepID=A0A7V2ZK29_9BACT